MGEKKISLWASLGKIVVRHVVIDILIGIATSRGGAGGGISKLVCAVFFSAGNICFSVWD